MFVIASFNGIRQQTSLYKVAQFRASTNQQHRAFFVIDFNQNECGVYVVPCARVLKDFLKLADIFFPHVHTFCST